MRTEIRIVSLVAPSFCGQGDEHGVPFESQYGAKPHRQILTRNFWPYLNASR